MTHQLVLQMRHREGAVVRTLGTIERRGFSLTGARLERVEVGLQATVQVVGDRPVDLLCRQLERLVDVLSARPECGPVPVSLCQGGAWS
jgi:acetolactate synthase regulatory subunit